MSTKFTRPGGMLTAAQRAALYTLRWPERPGLTVDRDRLYGVWVVGNDYRRANHTWGAYPNGFLERLTTVWPDLPRLHVFAGGVRDPEATTVDIRPECGADITGDVLQIGELVQGRRFATVMADPPYDCPACEVYGTKRVQARDFLPALAEVTAPGGHLIWLDVRTPVWSKRWWEWAGLVAVYTGTNRRIRALTILRRKR